MLSAIFLVIFVLCYAALLGIEISRLFRRTRWQLRAILIVGATAIFAQIWYLGLRTSRLEACPLSSPYDWCLLASWLLVCLYWFQSLTYSNVTMGLFLMPLTIGLFVAAQFAHRQPISPDRANRLWSSLHGSFLLVGTVVVLVGFSAGVMYLIQSYRLKQKAPSSPGLRLPSLEWLEMVNRRSLAISLMLIFVGFISGVILNQIKQHRGDYLFPWNDSVVLSSAVMLGWLMLAEAFHLIYRPARQGRKVAYLTISSFLFLVIVLSMLLFVDPQHGSSASGGAFLKTTSHFWKPQ